MAARILRRIIAVNDVEEIADYIATDSLEAAIRFLENTEATLRHLAEHPGIGAPFNTQEPRLEGLRACRVRGFPNHVVFYFNREESIEVIRVLRGARDIDSELTQD